MPNRMQNQSRKIEVRMLLHSLSLSRIKIHEKARTSERCTATTQSLNLAWKSIKQTDGGRGGGASRGPSGRPTASRRSRHSSQSAFDNCVRLRHSGGVAAAAVVVRSRGCQPTGRDNNNGRFVRNIANKKRRKKTRKKLFLSSNNQPDRQSISPSKIAQIDGGLIVLCADSFVYHH